MEDCIEKDNQKFQYGKVSKVDISVLSLQQIAVPFLYVWHFPPSIPSPAFTLTFSVLFSV